MVASRNGQLRSVMAWKGSARHGSPGQARQVQARKVMAGSGMAAAVSNGASGNGSLGCGQPRHGRQGLVRLAPAGRVVDGHASVWQGWARQAWLGSSRWAMEGLAAASRGRQPVARPGSVCLAAPRLGVAATSWHRGASGAPVRFGPARQSSLGQDGLAMMWQGWAGHDLVGQGMAAAVRSAPARLGRDRHGQRRQGVARQSGHGTQGLAPVALAWERSGSARQPRLGRVGRGAEGSVAVGPGSAGTAQHGSQGLEGLGRARSGRARPGRASSGLVGRGTAGVA